jgi:hypothetical protein
MTITPDDIVRREVFYCVSSLVSTLAGGYGSIENTERLRSRGRAAQAALSELTEQAFELASPLLDYEAAAEDEGWEFISDEFGARICRDKTDGTTWEGTAEDICRDFEIEPHEREVFEHWIVSDWLADKLAEHGEKVDKDFAGMTIWARTTTGQGIASDYVIERIAEQLNHD